MYQSTGCVAGLKIPRFVPTYEAVDATFQPILEDTKELIDYSAKRAAELEVELAKVEYELVCTPTLAETLLPVREVYNEHPARRCALASG